MLTRKGVKAALMIVYLWVLHFESLVFYSAVPTFAFATDIEKAFLHVKLHESDIIDYTRFLWLSDITNPSDKLATYCFKVVQFGTTSC